MGGPGSGPGNSGKAAERRRRALQLRLAGATYDQIAQQLEYSGKASAWRAVKEALAAGSDLGDRRREEIDLELTRLDRLLVALWPKAQQGDVQAIDRVLKIGERRAALLASGFDAVDQEPKSEGTPLDEFTRRLHDRQANTGRPGVPGPS